MRLVYHSLGNVDEGYGRDRNTGYSDSLRSYLSDVSRPDTEIELRGTRGGVADQFKFFATEDTQDVLESVVYARHAEIDGFAIGNVLDPGLQEAREVFAGPVTGFTELSALMSCMLGEHATSIPIHPKHEPPTRDLLRTYGLSERVSVRPMTVELDEMANGFTDTDLRDDIIDEFETAVAEAVAEDGAEVVIPGAGILSMFLNDAGIAELHGVPVIDGVALLIQMTEAMVDMYDVGTVATSRKSKYQGPSDEFMDDLEEMYDLR